MKISALLTAATVGVLAVAGPLPSAMAQGGSGGGGGGGTGGGGGGGGTGFAAIQTVGAAVSCDNGSAMTLTLRKGFAKRIEAVVSSAPTLQAGRWEILIRNETTGSPILHWATTTGVVTGLRWTTLGTGVPAGTYAVSFTATRRDSGSTIPGDGPAGVLLETCSAATTVVAR